MMYIISPYDDLFDEQMQIPMKKQAEYRFKYDLSNHLVEPKSYDNIDYLSITTIGNKSHNSHELIQLIRKSRITVFVK